MGIGAERMTDLDARPVGFVPDVSSDATSHVEGPGSLTPVAEKTEIRNGIEFESCTNHIRTKEPRRRTVWDLCAQGHPLYSGVTLNLVNARSETL